MRRRLGAAVLAAGMFCAGAFIAPLDAAPGPAPSTYVVEPGDSWVGIARKVGIPAQVLVNANCDLGVLNAKCPLHPGRILFFFPTETTPSTSTTVPQTATSHDNSTTTMLASPTTTSPPASSSTSSTTTGSTSVPTTVVPAAGFTEAFTAEAGVDRFDYQLHTSSNGGVNTLISDTFIGEHDHTCGNPTTHRTIHGGIGSPDHLDVSDSELVWYCAPGDDAAKGHMMTALDTADIATLSFSPKQTFTNVTQVCWDQNMNNLGEGKWLNVFVVPAADVATDGDLNYAAATGLPFGGDLKPVPADAFQFSWIRGSTMAFAGYTQTMDFWKSYAPGGMVPDGYAGPGGPSAPRFKVCLNSGANMTIQRPDGTTDSRAIGTTFPTGEVKVIFQDASYNPSKHEGSESYVTWHWDNIAVTVG